MQNQLTLAITGHRDIIETPKLKKEVETYLDSLLQDKQNKEIVLLSPLADGADRFVAQLFLDKKEQYPNLKLKVPMPFPQEKYMEDFDEASKKEFLNFLNFSNSTFSISNKKQNAYQTLGYYIADHADILLAIWDETFNGKSGGTGDVVAYAQSKNYAIKIFSCSRKGIA